MTQREIGTIAEPSAALNDAHGLHGSDPGKPGRPIERILRPFREFAHTEASGGIVLLVCTIIALAWANSPWSASYFALWHTQVSLHIGAFHLDEDLLHWINDGLMVIFFFVVGLEIKRELLVGELASPRRAALPIMAAAGGMIVPAAVYVLFNAGTPGISGWGVPMATDIAFALGVMALLGSRVPIAIKVFVTALAVVDDIGAVLVIALFYTPQIHWASLGMALLFLLAAIVANVLGVRRPLVYGLIGIGLWVAVLESGVHATVAGVLLAMAIPSRAEINAVGFLQHSRETLDVFRQASRRGRQVQMNQDQQAAVVTLEEACEQVQTPLQRLEHNLHPWVAFFIMPVFALANAGVALTGESIGQAIGDSVTVGVFLGLVVGKQVGVTLFTWLAAVLRLAELPPGVSWKHIYGASWLAGIGFTMSLFIAGLAFQDEEHLAMAKVGILAASVVAGSVGWLILGRLGRPTVEETGSDAAETADARHPVTA